MTAYDGIITLEGLLNDLLHAAHSGLTLFMKDPTLDLPVVYRLAFRELGLALGLHGVRKMAALLTRKPQRFSSDSSIGKQIRLLEPFAPLIKTIADFWVDEQNRTSRNWVEHADINSVMPATALNPSGFLDFK